MKIVQKFAVKTKWTSKRTISVTNIEGNKTPHPLAKKTSFFQNVRLIVDHCEASDVTEDINMSYEDRSACEAAEEVPGEQFILNVVTPLQLGGRAKQVNYPAGLTPSGFNGCIRNLRHNTQVRRLLFLPSANESQLVQIISLLLIWNLFICDLFVFRSMICISEMLENSPRLERKTGAHVPRMRAQTVPSTARVTAI